MKALTVLELEVKAANSDLTREDFEIILWNELVVKKNRKQINQFARDLNIYPRAVDVYYKLNQYFFSHIAK